MKDLAHYEFLIFTRERGNIYLFLACEVEHFEYMTKSNHSHFVESNVLVKISFGIKLLSCYLFLM
jgi:hypothetical protein